MRPPARASDAPIGVFDSGVGGLSVWRHILSMLPGESTLYFADQAHVPYGPRDKEQVRQFCDAITRFLLQHGAKLIVIACNTASGAALHWLREQYPDIPFVGMEPAVKPAVEHTKTGSVGVIATPTTFQGDLYHNLVERFGHGTQIFANTCPGLVTQIECGDLKGLETYRILESCISPLLEHNIDHLVLGCTHYPFVAPLIQQIVGNDITLIDPAPAVVRQVERMLHLHEMLSSRHNHETRHQLYTSGDPNALASVTLELTGYAFPSSQATWRYDMLEED